MRFHVGTFRVHVHFWPNLNFLFEHLMKVVLRSEYFTAFNGTRWPRPQIWDGLAFLRSGCLGGGGQGLFGR